MDPRTLLQMLSGVTPQSVGQAQNDLKSGKYRGAEVLTGDAGGPMSLGGLLKIMPRTLKDGTRLLTKVSTMEEVPRYLMEMAGAKQLGKVSLNPATISDMSKKVTGAPSAKSIWDTVDKLAAKGKGRKILYHVKKKRVPL
jgi:hypothetical protein